MTPEEKNFLLNNNKGIIKQPKKEPVNETEKSLTLFRSRSQALLKESLTENYQELAVGFANQLIEEFDCKTPSEQALAQMAALSHAKALDYSEALRDCRAIEWHSSQKNGFFSMIGKEIDRANRQFIIATMALKQLKAPSVEINVRAKTAFIAKNQQLNVNQDNNNNNENIEPK